MLNHKKGNSLNDPQAHALSHEAWNRRTFLRMLGLSGAGSILLGGNPVTALASSKLAALISSMEGDRILVLIRLKGGNDGLNTIIPVFDYSTYKSLRPGIAIPNNQIINLNTSFGIQNRMGALEKMWKDGDMKVVHSVGYPEQNLSHFRSSDIWATSSDSQVVETSGWLGRWLEDVNPDYLTKPPKMPPAIQIGGAGNLAFTNTKNDNMAVVVNDPEELARIAQSGRLYDPTDVPECYYGEQLTYLRTLTNATFTYAQGIETAYKTGKNTVQYPANLGAQLALVARLIKGGLGTRLYMVTLDGFDNHADQNQNHPVLLENIAQSVSLFYQDLQAGGWADKVLSMTISEFGRRPEQNASQGTDHGAASPLMLFGPGLNGNGFVGQNPNLKDLDRDGNLKFSTDFRQIYATVLESWLCIDGAEVDNVMGRKFNRLPALGLQCSVSTGTNAVQTRRLALKVSTAPRELRLQYELPESSNVQLRIVGVTGQVLQEQNLGLRMAGAQQSALRLKDNILPGIYIVQLAAGNWMGTEKVFLH